MSVARCTCVELGNGLAVCASCIELKAQTSGWLARGLASARKEVAANPCLQQRADMQPLEMFGVDDDGAYHPPNRKAYERYILPALREPCELRERIAELEAALRPFAEAAALPAGLTAEGWEALVCCTLQVSGDDLRAARAALEEK